MKRRWFVATLAALLLAGGLSACAPYGSGNPDGPPSDVTLLFADEFNGTTLDTGSWSTGWFGCKPVNGAETASYNDSQVKVRDGALHLTAITKQNVCNGTTYPYLTGMIQSRGKREYQPPVYVEARIWTNVCGGQNCNWFAWWLDGHSWPATGELDVAEGLGQMAATWHGPEGGGAGKRIANFGVQAGWHTYGALWTSESVVAYFDGHRVGSYTSASNVTEAPMYLILGEQIGQWGGPVGTPNTTSVDYVRVWRVHA